MKYLIRQFIQDNDRYYRFLSDKSKEELQRELDNLFISTRCGDNFTFQNITLRSGFYNDYLVITLDEFWEGE
jgi:hypothetical protein